MNTRIQRFVGIAAGIILAFAIVPATRWIVLPQLGYVVGINSGLPGMAFDVGRAAKTLPNDYRVQIVNATWTPVQTLASQFDGPGLDEAEHDRIVARLRALAQHFPNEPSIYAYLLGFEQHGPERDWLDPNHPGVPAGTASAPVAVSAEVSAAFLADATTGERLDPENGFFPMMAAAGHFGALDDKMALADLHRAAGKPQWDDYGLDQLEGSFHITDAGNQTSSGMAHTIVAETTPSPLFYADVRSVARMACEEARGFEAKGDVDSGLRIRFDVIRVGSRMRSESRTAIGLLVGNAISNLGLARPGNAAPIAISGGHPYAYWIPLRVQAFADYLARTGHSQDIAAVQADGSAMQMERINFSNGISKGAYSTNFPKCLTLWLFGSIVAAALAWTAVLCLLSSLESKWKSAATPLKGQRVAALVGCVAAVVIVVLFESVLPEFIYDGIYFTAFAALVVLVVALLEARREPKRAFRLGFVAVVSALGTVGALAGANFQSVFMHAVLGWAPDNELFHVPDVRQSIALILAVPIVLTITAAVLARLRRLPYLPTLSKLACAASCLLVGVYAVLVLATVRQDRVLNQQVTRETLDVQDYYADVAGKPWPAHTDWSSLDFH